MSDEKKNPDADKDFEKYVYFVSKAKNYGTIMEPRVEETLANGERKVSKDDDGKPMVGLRIEFHNGMKRLEKTPENKGQIEFLRKKCKEESTLPEKRQQIKELHKLIKKIPETEVEKMRADDKAEIKRLKEKLGETTEPEKNEQPAKTDKKAPF